MAYTAVAVACIAIAGWGIPHRIAERAVMRGPRVASDVDPGAKARLQREAGNTIAVIQVHPISRMIAPFATVTAVWRAPGHCADDEPGGMGMDRDYGASVRLMSWFGITTGDITIRCGGASWHRGGRAPRPVTSGARVRPPLGLAVESNVVLIRRVGHDLHADIPYTFVHARREPLVVTACGTPTPPVVQWQGDSGWTSAYVSVGPACSSAPLVLQPGVVHRDTLRLRMSHSPFDVHGRRVEPHWGAPNTASVFRLVWPVYEATLDGQRLRIGPLIPEAERTSAAFRVQVDAASNVR